MYFVGSLAEIDQDHLDLAAIAGVDGAGSIGDRDRALQGQSAPGPHLCFEAWRDLNREPCRHGFRNVRLQYRTFDGAQIHSGIFQRSVRVMGQMSVRVQPLQLDSHLFEVTIKLPAMSPSTKSRRVITVAPMPPEKSAYALARYSRSPDSIAESIDWVRTHNSEKFLESFYFQYGHASIADLGHMVVCFERISELAATELEDEQLWDGQARSSR